MGVPPKKYNFVFLWSSPPWPQDFKQYTIKTMIVGPILVQTVVIRTLTGTNVSVPFVVTVVQAIDVGTISTIIPEIK